jgi:2'-5' RNA ligase
VHGDGDGGSLTELAAEVDQALETLGFPPETRPFHAHITLGRVKQGSSQDLLEGVEEISFKHSECTVHEVVLYRSVLERKGAEYTPLARFPLAAARTGEGSRAITEEKEHGH